MRPGKRLFGLPNLLLAKRYVILVDGMIPS